MFLRGDAHPVLLEKAHLDEGDVEEKYKFNFLNRSPCKFKSLTTQYQLHWQFSFRDLPWFQPHWPSFSPPQGSPIDF